MSESDLDCTPPDVSNIANMAVVNLLPEKSKHKYNAQYNNFVLWCESKKIKKYSENVLLAYFSSESEKYTSSTLWSHYSMLRTTLNVKNNIDISKFSKLISFLKRKSDGYRPKKSKLFKIDEINKFLTEAPDDKFLFMKVVLIFGVAGACRREELVNITIDDIQDVGSALIIRIPFTKTKTERTFTITNSVIDLIGLYRKYVNLRPANCEHRRFFINYLPSSSKCTKQPVGINKIGKIPFEIASYLNLQDTKLYTGHSFRRTSATLLVEAGGDITSLKRHGGWKSTSVAEGYIENCLKNKLEVAKKVLGENFTCEKNVTNADQNIQNTDASTSRSCNVLSSGNSMMAGINISNCSNCIINLNI